MMTEKEQILGNNNGEIPEGEFDIIRIKNIPNPQQELNTFKQTVLIFLENSNLDAEDSKWEKILPQPLVQFTDQLKDEDFHNDDLITALPNIINDLQEIKEWEWYSSKLTKNGFEVYVKGMFRYVFRAMIHQQGIPHTSIFVERQGKEYLTNSLKDVLTYRKWNPDSLKLK
jgi:hypothetical protein